MGPVGDTGLARSLPGRKTSRSTQGRLHTHGKMYFWWMEPPLPAHIQAMLNSTSGCTILGREPALLDNIKKDLGPPSREERYGEWLVLPNPS